jgi:hypothetical protein
MTLPPPRPEPSPRRRGPSFVAILAGIMAVAAVVFTAFLLNS